MVPFVTESDYMFHVCVYYAVVSVPCSLVKTCWERVDLLALVCDVSSQVWYLIASIPDLCLRFTLIIRVVVILS